MGTGGADQHNWSEEDKRREREADAAERQADAAVKQAVTAVRAVDKQKWTVRIQAAALAVAALATMAAVWVAYQAGEAVKASERIAAQQATENRLSMAVSAIGETSPADQIAGLTLLRRNVRMQLAAAMTDPGKRQDAYDAYSTSLDVLHVYLRGATTPGRDPLLAIYAANELKKILDMGGDVRVILKMGPVDERTPPSMDLSLVRLPGVNWTGTRFDQLYRAYMPGIDLRGADLAGSRWGYATLIGAHLQCADLKGADLRWANLSGADLRGADLRGAQLPSAANLKGVHTAGAIGPVKGLHIDNPGTSYSPYSCS